MQTSSKRDARLGEDARGPGDVPVLRAAPRHGRIEPAGRDLHQPIGERGVGGPARYSRAAPPAIPGAPHPAPGSAAPSGPDGAGAAAALPLSRAPSPSAASYISSRAGA